MSWGMSLLYNGGGIRQGSKNIAMKTFIWSIVVPLIVGIASGLTVQPIQRWWLQRSNRSNSMKLAQIKIEYNRALHYSQNPEMLIAKLTMNVMLITFEAFLGLGAISLPIVFNISTPIPHANTYFMIGEWIGIIFLTSSTIFITVLISDVFNKSIRLYAHVELFEDYVNGVPSEIRDLALESEIIARRKRGWNIPKPAKNDEA
jgi:hypothetical protein